MKNRQNPKTEIQSGQLSKKTETKDGKQIWSVIKKDRNERRKTNLVGYKKRQKRTIENEKRKLPTQVP